MATRIFYRCLKPYFMTWIASSSNAIVCIDYDDIPGPYVWHSYVVLPQPEPQP